MRNKLTQVGTFKINPFLAVDSYKVSHRAMYPEGLKYLQSNMTPRSDKYLRSVVPQSVYDGKIVAFGLQGLVKQYFTLWYEEFFSKPKEEVVPYVLKL